MTIEERLEQAEKLVAEVKAELAAMRAEKATKRNWPERIEAGMVFKAKMTEATWMAVDGVNLVCIANGEKGGYGVMCDIASPNALDYLGHARDILTIRTDAHEPTGAELVGRLCEFSDDGCNWVALAPCGRFDPKDGQFIYRVEPDSVTVDGDVRAWFRFARLAK